MERIIVSFSHAHQFIYCPKFLLFMKKQILSIRSLLMLFVAWIGINSSLLAQVSVTATSGTTGPTTYTTVNAAFTAINAGTHQGDILITVTANTTEPATPVQLLRSGAGSSAYQSVKIMPSGNVTINSATTPTAGRGILEFIGADFVTIDGDDPSTGGVRNLSIQMATTTNASTACIRFSSSTATSDGCTNAKVKNCNITGGRSSAVVTTASYGIYSGLSSATATITTATGAADNDSMLIENNAIQRCYYGIYAYGIATYLMDNLVIRNNAIGSNVQANNVGLRGIYVANTQTTASANSLLIEGNDIQGGDTLTGWGATIAGIDLNVSNAGAIIRNNNIHNVEQPSTGGWGAYGLFISSATNNANIHIYNNFIRDIRAFHYTTGFNQYTNYGIYSTVAVTNLRINNNTIVLAKPNNGTGTSNFSACVALSSTATPVIEFKNNIIVNKQSDNTGQTCTGFYIGGAATLNTAAVNSNAYYVTGASGFVGRVGGTNYASLPTWRTATNRDSNSFFVEPSFVSSTDLHLTTGVKSILESNGLTITGYNTDFDGQARPGPTGSVYGGGFNFDIGADEADLPPDNFGYDSSSVTQISGVIPAGSNNNALLRIKVSVSGSVGTPVNLSNIYFNTIGSTTASDIVAAKVYYTGSNSTFSASSQYGSTVTSPNGQFAVSGAQSLAAGVNYFWLSYDVSPTAANNNLVDARLDSILVDGIGKIPVNNNPAGSLQIALPMTYVSSTSEHVDLTKVETGSTNNRLLRVFIKTSTSGAPVNLTQLNLNTNGGGDDTSNINNIKVYYTGSNPNFSAINQFGSTFIQTTPVGSSWGAFSINGIRALQNDSNFFWVTYDIKTAAILGDSVDAECTGFTFGTTPYTPTITAPIGNRLIRSPYCPSAATSPGDEEIWNVTIGSLNNTSTCTTAAPGPGSVTAMYSNYTISVAAPNIASGVPVPFSVNTASCGGNYNSSLGIYIDYNQNGIFDLPGEMAYSNNTFTSSTVGAQIISGNITVPCTALGGLTRMRVVLVETTAGTTPCGTYTWGETEDYSVNIVTGAASYSASNAIQFTGTTSSGATDVKILRVPVKVFSSPCNPGVITELRFNTAGSTSAADISNAKLYKTGNSNVFSVANLVGTANSPSGQFTFSVTDTAVNDTNNYWLAYDVSASATSTNVLDARVDSILVFGNWFVPTNNAPTGNLVITNPMTYIGSSATHPDLSMAESPSTNARMLRAMVVMSSSGAPVSVTQLSLDATGGGDDTSNIANVKVFYTGNSANFASTNQFGSTFVQTTPTGNKYGAFNINGIVNLLNDTNYFWVTYDIKSTAILGDSVDAEITGITIGGVNQAPTNSAPSGNRRIRAQYCPSYATSTADEEIWNVSFGTLNNTSTCATTAPGAGSVNTVYSNYTTSVAAPNIPIGVPVPFSVNTASCGGNYNSSLGIYIDYNQNGIFDLPGEVAYTNNAFTSSNTGAQIVSGNITIPCTAMGGNTRMRVVLVETTTGTTPCGTYTWGETEDYTINIVAGAATFTNATAIQITGSTSAGSLDVPVLRVPLKVFASPCNPALITNFRFNTAGTTSAGDIVSAKLYKTGASSAFSTSNLVGTLSAPNGVMEFVVSDTANNDTNYYWLAYDVSSTATNNNVLDARFDSTEVFGSFRLPINGNPTGNRLIATPMTYISSTTMHPELTSVQPNSTNNRMLRILIRASSAGAPVAITSFSLNTNGGSGNDTLNLANAKVFYTGNSSVFSTSNQFGSTYSPVAPTSLAWPAFQITGTQPLLNDTNYFWVTYDLKAGAITLDSIDVEVTSLDFGVTPQTPTVTAPAGSRRIRNPYCPSNATTTADGEIWNVTIGSLNNTSSCTTTGGTGSSLSQYSNFTETLPAASLVAGMPLAFSVYTSTCGGSYQGILGIWIDLNQDGDFTDAGETQYMSPTSFAYGTNVYVTGNINIPCTATPGITRMRVSLIETTVSPISSCGTYGYGETEDYAVNIVNGSPSFANTTAIQRTGVVMAGTNDVPVLRVPVKVAVSSCSPGLVTNVRFNTAGTTTVGNITAAKLYKTGASGNFSTANLIGTLSSPSGLMEFVVSDTATNDTNNYWLAYDVSSSAISSNVLDARFDSIEVFGAFRTPIANNPSGNVLITNPIVPTLTTIAASNITTTTGTIGGAVTFNGFATVTGTGVVYSTSPNPVRFGTGVVDSASVVAVPTGNFSFNIVGLTQNTKYYYRAYAINSVGTGYSVQDSFTTAPIINSLPYSQNFESGAGGWTSALTSTNSAVNWIIGFATNNNWVLGTPAKTYLNGARSGTKAWVTKLTGTYDIDHDASLLSPQFDFTSFTNDPVVRFNHKFKAESDWDGLIVEMSINNGYWRRLDSVVGTGSNFNTPISYAWYNDNVNYVSSGGVLAPPYFSNDIGSGSVYSSQDSGWIQSAFKLIGAAGQSNVRVRFRFISDTYVVDEGWAIDDIEVVNIVTPTIGSSSVSASSSATTTMNVGWTSGNGNARLVVARLNATSAVAPTNNTLYTPNAAFGGATTTGTGNYVVYNGTGTSVVVTGLAASTQYAFDVYEYNGKYMHNMFTTASTGSSTTLPVSWLSFTGFANGENVDLVWVTAQEINNKGFEVERSIDGITFENVGFVKGAGNYNGKLNYAFVDAGVLSSNAIVYYRLKQVDFDNRFEYSSTIVVRNNVEVSNDVKVFPNPFKETVSIELRNATELTGTATLIDIEGRIVKSISLNLSKGYGSFEMSGLDELKDGVYFVKVNIGGQSYQEKLVKVGK